MVLKNQLLNCNTKTNVVNSKMEQIARKVKPWFRKKSGMLQIVSKDILKLSQKKNQISLI